MTLQDACSALANCASLLHKKVKSHEQNIPGKGPNGD